MRCHHSVKQCALRARSTQDVHHAIVGVNVVIGVLVAHCELHVVVRVHVPLDVVRDEAVVFRTLGLITLVVIVVWIFAVWETYFLHVTCQPTLLIASRKPNPRNRKSRA